MHQVIRAAAPIFTAILSFWLFRTRISRYKIISLLPVVLGVGFATYGDYYCTFLGFVLTLLGTLLAALKTIATNVVQSSPPVDANSTANMPKPFARAGIRLPPPFRGQPLSVPYPAMPTALRNWFARGGYRLGLHPLDLLVRISPLALVQCAFYAHASGEVEALQAAAKSGTREMGMGLFFMLLANGFIAFVLNVVSFETNRRAGALTMGVAGTSTLR